MLMPKLVYKMITQLFILFCIAQTLVGATSFQEDSLLSAYRISGTIKFERATDGKIYVWAMPCIELENGQIQRPSKQDIFAASQSATNLAASQKYSLSVPPGHHCVFAFADLNDNGKWDPAEPEPFGWYASQPAGRFDVIHVNAENVPDMDFMLKAPRHFSGKAAREIGGTLRNINGYTVLQLQGDAKSRGYAHGKLIAPQIVDFFRFYILEDKIRSAKSYEIGFSRFLKSHFAYPTEFVSECTAVLEGMYASGENLFIPELGREFNLTDLYAINGYIETRAMRSSCTQFAAWGERTAQTDVAGGMITGRNMDGEIDIRKVTVSHFLLFAVDPQTAGQKRYVSMMWPGFVGTISGINEDGFYTMENAGLTGPGPVVRGLVPISWTMRETLAKLGADATPESTQAFINDYDNPEGGVSGPGCIMIFAVPYKNQPHPAFVFEGDRFGDAIRVAEEVKPDIKNALVCSNHHRKYGFDPRRPDVVFDKRPSFSSLWRYEAGMHKLEAWDRIDKKIGTEQMQQLLQTVAHGTTEYSIITRPNVGEFDVAVASMKAEPWDAPYRKWTTFKFDEAFDR